MLAIGEARCQNWKENRYIGQSFSQSTASTTTFSENHWKRTVQKYYYNNTTALGVGTTHIPPYFCDNTQPNEQSAFAPKGAVLPLPLAEHMDWTRYECPGTLLHLVRVKLPRSERHQCQESFLEKKPKEHLPFCMQVLWPRGEISFHLLPRTLECSRTPNMRSHDLIRNHDLIMPKWRWTLGLTRQVDRYFFSRWV